MEIKEKVIMKMGKIIRLSSFLVLVIFFSCKNNIDLEVPDTAYKGSISGVALYTNETDNSSIYITLDKTDELRAAKDKSQRVIESYSNCSEDGSFLFRNLKPGKYTVYASSSYSLEKTVFCNVEIHEDEEKILSEKLKLTAIGEIRGKITLDSSEKNNSGFTVYIAGTSYTAKTNSAGEFTLSNIPAGSNYELYIEKGNFSCYWKTVDVKAFNTIDILQKNITSEEIKNKDVSSSYEIRTTDILPGDINYPAGGVKIEILKNGIVIETKYIENGTSEITFINYELYGGSFTKEPEVSTNYGKTVGLSTPTKEHNTFMGWYLSDKFEGEKINSVTCDGTRSQITLYAKWIPDIYINYELNGGTLDITPVDYCKYDNTVSLQNTLPKKEHYTFAGWYSEEKFNGENIKDIFNDGSQNQITLYAKWLPNLFVSFAFDGGNLDMNFPIEVTVGEKISLSTIVPYREGYFFDGWYSTSDYKNDEIVNVIADGIITNQEYYAKWVLLPANSFTCNNLSDYLNTLSPQEEPYPINLVGYIDFKILNTCLVALKGKGIYIDLKINHNITEIDDDSFKNCSCLKSINLPDSINTIGDRAFYNCYHLETINLPNRLSSVGTEAFYYCESLESITLPDSITTIGDRAFSNCSSLESITLPDSITTIGDYAFSNCRSLESITLPDSITTIGDYAFYNCRSLESITIPNSIIEIGKNAFEYCSNITKVNISDLYSWCAMNFTNETENPLYYAKHLYLNNNEITDLVIPEGVTEIGAYTFVNCSEITSVTIPSSVTGIGSKAFDECSNITTVNIFDLSLWCTMIFGGETANPLYYAKHLYLNNNEIIDLVIPDGVSYINSNTFSNFSGITTVTMSDSVTSIGNSAFENCVELTSVHISDNVRWIGRRAFEGCKKLKIISLPRKIERVLPYAFPTYLNTLIVSNASLKLDFFGKIGSDYPWYGYIKEVILLDDITEIPEDAFYYYSQLEKVIIPTSVKKINVYAFPAKVWDLYYMGTEEEFKKVYVITDYSASTYIPASICYERRNIIYNYSLNNE